MLRDHSLHVNMWPSIIASLMTTSKPSSSSLQQTCKISPTNPNINTNKNSESTPIDFCKLLYNKYNDCLKNHKQNPPKNNYKCQDELNLIIKTNCIKYQQYNP